MDIEDTVRKRKNSASDTNQEKLPSGENEEEKLLNSEETRSAEDKEAQLKSALNRLERKLYPDLPNWEYYLYTSIWITCIGYSVYLFHLESLKRRSSLYTVKVFNPWWYFGSRTLYKDYSDHEWETWKLTLSKLKFTILALLFPLFSQVIKRISMEWNLYLCAMYSVMFMCTMVGIHAVAYLMLQIVIIFTAYRLTNNPIVIWMTAMVYSQVKTKLDEYVFPEYEDWIFAGYITMITAAWMNCRCVSFCLDRIWGKVPRESSTLQSFIKLTGYCFYLPLCAMGPLISSKQFQDGLERKHNFDLKLLKFLSAQALRYFLWYIILELMLAFVYQQAFTSKAHFVETMGMWQLCGMCYLLGQFFQLKYVMMYGTSSFMAKLDNIDAPPHPKCIGRIHLYSDMWRHFDVGLYEFMHQYIYTPLAGKNSSFLVRMTITVIIFAFVYVWHGVQDFILVWSILNCFGILCENAAREMAKSPTYTKIESDWLGAHGQRRFHAAISAPLFLMSCLSNFYFFTGMQVGNVIVRRTFSDTWPFGFPFLLFVLYTGSQFSIQVKNWELRKEMENMKKKFA